MTNESVEILVIGAGQAGLAISEHLGNRKLPHLVVERNRIAERWRSERWDSLVANGPAWHDRFPTMKFPHIEDDGFASRDMIVDYFEAYAAMINAPIRTGVEITALRQSPSGRRFKAETRSGTIEADHVVVATGPFQRPIIPTSIPSEAGILQFHSSAYRNPSLLPEGGVLVIGAGSSGAQIADELVRAGKKVYLSIGPHDRPPRRYRGKDFVWWLGVLGKWDIKTPDPKMEHVTISVSGAQGGQTIDFREFAERGMNLVGRAGRYENGLLHFASDLKESIERGDANYLSVLREADDYVRAHHLDMPEEPQAHIIRPEPKCMREPTLSLDLKEAGISSIIWATGYALDFSWIDIDIFDDKGRPKHARGVSEIPGLYFLGLAWLARRASPFIWGVWHDAAYLAEQIAER
jgi:putative flavoprotein involved in K+ transport